MCLNLLEGYFAVLFHSEAVSSHELEALDPQKRELLEARIAGKVINTGVFN